MISIFQDTILCVTSINVGSFVLLIIPTNLRIVNFFLLFVSVLLADFAGNNISEKELNKKFGTSEELVKSAAFALEGRTYSHNINVSEALQAASQVASCEYEYGTGWGDQVETYVI